MVSIGDMKNNMRILQTEARHIKYNEEFDLDGLAKGNPQALLPVYNHLFTNFNPQFTADVTNMLEDGLYMKSDVRFMESVYRVLRDMFCFKPSMTKEQFFTMNMYAERKIIMCIEIMRLVQDRYRFIGPKNPTNPNIKVSSVVDTGLHPKKVSSHELVTSEPSSDGGMNRKVADKGSRKPADKVRKPMSALMGMNEKEGWQLKLGYLRPKSPEEEENNRKGTGEADSGREVPKEDHSKIPLRETLSEKTSREEIAQVVSDAARTSSPPSSVHHKKSRSAESRGKAVEVVHMPRGKRSSDGGHMRVADLLGKIPENKKKSENLPDQAQSDWDPSEAVECILAKVRDLPAQLTSFMKAVEGRLMRIEERLENVEGMTAKLNHAEAKSSSQANLKRDLETLQARLLLLENRMVISESKESHPLSPEPVRLGHSTEERKGEFTTSPFVSLERGDHLFSNSPMHSFSPLHQGVAHFTPVRQVVGDLTQTPDNTFASIADADNRRTSTPNQSTSATPSTNANPSSSTSNKVQGHDTGATECGDITATCENLDTSTQQQVERIKNLFKATQLLLPPGSGGTSVEV